MGSFDVACSVSRITINSGDPVAYFPLELYKYCYDPKAPNNILIYPWCYYVPVSLPIFGEYYDYGFIDQIEEDVSTKSIEKHFKCTIKNMVGAEGLSPLAGMFVHRDIYQCMVDTQIDDYGQSPKDGEHFGSCTRNTLNARYDKYYNALKEFKRLKKEKKKNEKEDKTDFTLCTKIMMAEHDLDDVGKFFINREFETFHKIYKPLVQKGWLKKQFVDFIFFNHSLSYTNVHYFPAANGHQFGNHYGNRAVHQKTLDILNKKIEEDEKQRAEDE